MAGRIKMPLGTEVGLGPGDFVLDGDPAPPKRDTAFPLHFSVRLLWPWSPISAAAELLLDMSQLLQLDPCDVVHHTHRVVDKGGHWV